MGRLAAGLFFLVSSFSWSDNTLTVAVTASFKPVMEDISNHFTKETGIELRLSSASTGVLYQQAVSGAPFDIFFSADALRPELLAENMALPESSVATYALGQLVLVSNQPDFQTLNLLIDYKGRVVIANPAHAPYGVAAQQVLNDLAFDGSPVLANNVTQARQYLMLNLAPVGLIAASVSQGFKYTQVIDPAFFDPIIQKYVILKPSAEIDALIKYLSSDVAQSIILKNGYLLPG